MAYSHNPYSLAYNMLTDQIELFPDAKWINVLILNHTRTIVAPLQRQDEANVVRLSAQTFGVVYAGWYKATLTIISRWFDQGEERYDCYPNETILLEIDPQGLTIRQSPTKGVSNFNITAQTTPQQITFNLSGGLQEQLRGIEVASLNLERIS